MQETGTNEVVSVSCLVRSYTIQQFDTESPSMQQKAGCSPSVSSPYHFEVPALTPNLWLLLSFDVPVFEQFFILSNQAPATRQGGQLRGIWSSDALFSARKEQR